MRTWCTVQSPFIDIIFTGNLWISDYFSKTIFSIYYIKSFDLVTLCNLVTVFAETKSVTNSRVHCIVSLKTLYLNYLIDMTGTHLKLVQFLVQKLKNFFSTKSNQNKQSIFVFWTTNWEFNCKTYFAIKNYFAPIWGSFER